MNETLLGILVFVIYLLALIITASPSPKFPFYSLVIIVLGLLISVLGLIFWFLGFLTLRGSFSIAPKAKKLVKNGIYEHLRHPIYNGIFLTFFGLSLAKGSLYGLLFSLFILYSFLKYRSHLEEKTLLKKFGKEYRNYLNNTSSLT